MPFVSREEVDFTNYSAIIVGSGPAAGSLAARLSQHNRNSLLIETGAEHFRDDLNEEFGTIKGWAHYDGHHWSSHWVRMLGGTSNVWGGWCAPMISRNFDSWPITRSVLDHYYISAAKLLGVQQETIAFEKPTIENFTFRPIADEEALKFSDPTRFGTYRQDPNVHVLLEHTVGALTPSHDRRAVSNFNLYSKSTQLTEKIILPENQPLVLAAGAMGNAKILLGSTIQGERSVGNENDQVGLYLQEHPQMDAGKIICLSHAVVPILPENLGRIHHAVFPNDDLFLQAGSIDVGIVLSEASIDSTDPVERFLKSKFGNGLQAHKITAMSEMEGRKENRVSANGPRDASGLPGIEARCVIDARTFEAVDTTVRALGESLVKSNTGRLRIDAENIFSRRRGGGHTIGTTRMGSDPKSSVVDANCRVHSYRNLFVAGSSVFSSGGCVNPTLTIVALAQRLADYLSKGM